MTYETFRLWNENAPGALGSTDNDIPTITVYPARQGSAPHPAMVILPGGGYRFLAQHEGPAYAEWLSENGFTSFLVKYRLASDGYRYPTMLWDAARAMRWSRAHAARYAVDPHRIGMIGSSAGGHLLASLATHFDAGDPNSGDPVERASSRPNAGVLCYAVLSTDLLGPDSGLVRFLLGENPDQRAVDDLSPVNFVSPGVPPFFLMHTVEDAKVNVMHSLVFAEALHQNGVPFELHVYEKGRHGIALANGHPWTTDCVRWLSAHLKPGNGD